MPTLETFADRQLVRQRTATETLIKVSGVDIAIIRQTRVADGAGGFLPSAATTLTAVRRYLVAKGREPGDTPDDTKRYEFVLVGLHTDDIRDNDEFLLGGRRYHVDFVYSDKSYQVKAEVFTNAS